MSEQYLLPCECGRSIAVTSSDSGGTSRCDCGRTVDIPQLRDLQRYPRRGSGDASAETDWDHRKAILFVGAMVFVVASIFALFKQFNRRSDVDPKDVQDAISRWSVTECFDAWFRFRDGGIFYESKTEMRQRLEDEIAVRWIRVAKAVMAFDVAIVAGILLVTRKPSPKPPRPG